jgi:hypothetical protein
MSSYEPAHSAVVRLPRATIIQGFVSVLPVLHILVECANVNVGLGQQTSNKTNST